MPLIPSGGVGFINRVIANAGATVTVAGNSFRAIRETEEKTLARFTSDALAGSGVIAVWYCTASDYTAYLTQASGLELTCQGIKYTIARVVPSEDGDSLQMATIICTREIY